MKFGLQNYNSKYYLQDFIIGSLLQNDPEYQIISLVMSIFSEIQILGLTYWLAINENSTDISYQGMSNTIMKIAKAITFDYFSSATSARNVENFFWIGSILVILLILDIWMIISYYLKKIYRPIQKLWFLFMSFLFSTFFLMAYRLSIHHITQKDDLKLQNIESNSILSITFIVFILVHAYLAAWMCIYPLSSQRINYGFRKFGFNLSGLTFKVIVIPLFTMEGANAKWIKSIFVVLLLLARMFSFIYEIPTDNLRVFGIFLIFCTLQVSSSVIGLLVNVSNSLGDYFCHINFIISPILCLIAIHSLKAIVKKFAFLKSKNMKNDDYFFVKLACIKYILQKGSPNAFGSESSLTNEFQILYYSIVKEHNINCHKTECGCSIILEIESTEPKVISNSEKQEKIDDLYYQIIKENYLDGISHLKDNFMLRLNYSFFLANGKTQDIINSILSIFTVDNEKLTLNQKFIRKRLVYILENQIKTKYSSIYYIHVDNFYSYECLKEQFREKMNTNVQRYLEFWQSYISEMFEVAPMIIKAEEINNETISINKIWNDMRCVNESSSTEALEYSIYISNIANAPHSARKIEKNFYKKVLMLNSQQHIDINNQNIDLKTDAFVYFSIKTCKIEQIACTLDFLGFTPKEMIGKSIKEFILPSMNEYLDNLLANPYSFDESSFLHQTHILTLYNKKKFITLVSAYFAPVPQFNHDILMLCVIRERSTKEDIVALNENGMIEGVSQVFGSEMCIDPFIHKKIKISDICSNYDKINNRSNLMMHSIRYFEATHSGDTSTVSRQSDHKKTKFVNLLKGFKHRKFTVMNNDLTLTFKPYKALGSFIDFSVGVRRVTDSLFILELERIKNEEDEEDEDESQSQNDRMDNDSSIDKLFEEDLDDKLTVEYTHYKKNQEEPNPNQIKNGDKTKVNITSKSRLIRHDIDENSSKGEKKLSKMSNEDHHQKKILDFIDSNSVGSRISSKGREEKYFKLLEEAIYKKKSILSLQVLNVAIILHTIMSIILLVIYIYKSNTANSEIPHIVDMMKNNQQKIYWTYDNYWNGWLELSISQGFLNEGFGYYGQDYYAWLMSYYQSDGISMLQNNNLIRQNVHIMSSTLANYLNEPFIYQDKYTYENRYGNFYEVEIELGNSALSFFFEYSVRDYYPPLDHPDLNFIRKNSLNGLLIRSEALFDLLADEGSFQMQFVYEYLIAISFVIIGLSVSIYFGIFISELLYRKEKSLFIDSFLQIRPEQAKDALNMAQEIKSFLLNDGSKHNTNVTNFYEHLKKKKNYGLASKKRAVNYSGLYLKSYLFLIILFLFQIAIGGVLLAINDIFRAQKEQTLTQLKQIADTNNILFKFSSTFLTLYEYINTDGTSFIRYKPLSEEWVSDYNELVGSYRFFFGITAKDPTIMNKISFILNGDLCQDTFVNGDCSYDIPKQGLLSINSYVLTALSQIKEVYDQSDKSYAAKNTALNLEQFRKAETVYFYNAIVVYSMIQELLQEDIYLFLDKQKTETVKIISILSVLMVIFTRLFWYPIWKLLVKERNGFGRFMRIIPFNIILNNGYLKAYLLTYANHILHSIKHTL